MGLLVNSRLFHRLPDTEVERLERVAVLRSVPGGSTVFKEGDPGDGMYVVVRGEVHISCLLSPNDRRVLSRLGAGDFFGEMAVLDSQPRSATATAAADAGVAFLPSQEVWDALERCPVFALNLVREFSLRIRDFNQTYSAEVVQAERLALVGRFARSVVHDFKNPLNNIGISADMAAVDAATPEMRRAARDRIRRQVDRLSNMISELLEFTRGKSGTVVLGRLDYGQFVRALIEEIRGEISVRRVRIELENDPPSARVPVDPRRLGHVFHNLVNNACDAMPEGGTVTFRFVANDREVLTEIRDSGPGIAPEISARLFEAFATFGKPSGTGLGLSICRRIIEDHHGHISARNAPGGGAIFGFTLPCGPHSSITAPA